MKDFSFISEQFDLACEVFENKIYSDKDSAGVFEEIPGYLGIDEKEQFTSITDSLDTLTDNMYRFLADTKHDDLQYSFTIFFTLLYYASARIEILIKLLDPSQKDENLKFNVFQKITKWANFIKHPKAFFLTHIPDYYLDNDPELIAALAEAKVVIDNEFIFKYYSDYKKNDILANEVANKVGVIVKVPNLITLSNEFCDAILRLNLTIKDNEQYKTILLDKTTINESMFDENDDQI